MAHLAEIFRLFGSLGTFTFGGPAVYIAAMQEECVERRRWLDRQAFLDLLGVTSLLPGPNATEMAANLGYRRGGALGAWIAGLAFTLPSVLVSLALAWGYVRYGTMPEVEPFLRGIKPVVWAIVVVAAWRLAWTSWRTVPLAVLGIAAAVAVMAGANEIAVLAAGSILGALAIGRRAGTAVVAVSLASGSTALAATAATTAGASAATIPLWKLGLFFLKIGAVWFGGGYVLIAYLEGGLVRDTGLLSQQQLVDAVAVGQITPGPVLSTVTFIGYLLCGLPGGLVATAAILAPTVVVISLVNPLVSRLRGSRAAARFLDAVNAVCVGLTAAVCLALGQATLVDWRSAVLAIGAAFVLVRWKLQTAWLIAAGAIVGFFFL